MTLKDKLQVQSLLVTLTYVSRLSSEEEIAQAKNIVTQLYAIFYPIADQAFVSCSNSVVDYSCPERTKFLDLVDKSV